MLAILSMILVLHHLQSLLSVLHCCHNLVSWRMLFDEQKVHVASLYSNYLDYTSILSLTCQSARSHEIILHFADFAGQGCPQAGT